MMSPKSNETCRSTWLYEELNKMHQIVASEKMDLK